MNRNLTRWTLSSALTATLLTALLWIGTTMGNQPTAHATSLTTIDARPKARATFRNPLKKDGADPWLEYYDGWYYLSTTTAVDVKLRRARKLGDLATAPDVEVWKDTDPSRSHDVWAAEFHRLDNGHGEKRWYLYYTASDGKDDAHHRLYVCESAGASPMGPYTFKAPTADRPRQRLLRH